MTRGQDRPEIDEVACNSRITAPTAVRADGPRTGALEPCSICFDEDDPEDFEWIARGGQHAQRVHKLPEFDVSSPLSEQNASGPSRLLVQLQREDVTSVDDVDLQETGPGGDA